MDTNRGILIRHSCLFNKRLVYSVKVIDGCVVPIFSKFMKPLKFIWISGIYVMSLLLCGRVAVAQGGPSAVVLSAGQIFERMREQYASQCSYSDEGQIITTVDGVVITTRFTTRLARPAFYRIEWDQSSHLPDHAEDTGIQGAWCSGAGDYVQMGWGLRRQYSLDSTLENVACSSSGAVADVPRIFFDVEGSVDPNEIIGLQRLADDKAGNIECYQIAGQSESGEQKTFWIGRRDFLIHQIRTEISPTAMRLALTGLVDNATEFHASCSTETYTNIVVNTQFSRADFFPSFPLYRQ
jgi:hypothetical protein